MIYSDDLLAAAKRIFWFGTPEEALEFPKRFLARIATTLTNLAKQGNIFKRSWRRRLP